MTKIYSKACLVLLAFAVFFLVFVVGVHVGVAENAKMQSAVRASLIIGQLTGLREGRTEKVIDFKELELDSEILLYGSYINSKMSWIFFLNKDRFVDERYLRAIAAYRSKFPNVSVDFSGVMDERIRMEMINNEHRIKSITEDIKKKYGEKDVPRI